MTSPSLSVPGHGLDAVDLVGLIGSRICHDLISPLGAIGNGVELLAMAGTSQGPETALIEDSVRNANARIRFFRVAFGAAQDGQMLSRREILAVLDDLSHGSRVDMHWDVDGDVDRAEARLAFLALQCFETVMPFGGEVRVIRHPDGWHLRATSERFRDEPGLWAFIEGTPTETPKPSEVHFALAPLVAADLDRPLSLTRGDTRIDLRF